MRFSDAANLRAGDIVSVYATGETYEDNALAIRGDEILCRVSCTAVDYDEEYVEVDVTVIGPIPAQLSLMDDEIVGTVTLRDLKAAVNDAEKIVIPLQTAIADMRSLIEEKETIESMRGSAGFAKEIVIVDSCVAAVLEAFEAPVLQKAKCGRVAAKKVTKKKQPRKKQHA